MADDRSSKDLETGEGYSRKLEQQPSADGAQTQNLETAQHGEKGVEVLNWDGPNDPDNPFNWSRKYKWLLTITTCFISILTGLPAGSYGAGDAGMEAKFHISQQHFPWLFWATTSWNIGAATFPLLFVPLTENSGRMPGYFISYIVFLIFLFPSAFAQNFATMIVTRLIGGGASSVSINIVGGTISDIWKGPKERSIPMSIFGMTSVIGIALGPFIGGAIQRNLDWRWIYYIQIIFDGGCLPIFWFILKETRGDVILARKAKKLRKSTGRNIYAKAELTRDSIPKMLKISFTRPTKMLFTEWVVFSFTIWVSFAWGILFLFSQSISQTFSTNYGFSVFQTSMIQLAISFGAIVGTIINPLQDRLYLSSARRNKETPGRPIPEARLYFSVPGSLLFTAGLFWYGWSSYPHVPWPVPALGIGCVGLGIYSIYLAVVNYLADAYEKYAASALSAASLGRNTFGAFLPLASPALYTNVGFQWGSSLLGFIGLVLSLAPVLLFFKGEEIRQRSPFMSEATFDEAEGLSRRSSLRHPPKELRQDHTVGGAVPNAPQI
ncbi:MFS general substrate transporter [Xylona heveae TC161]|uniref:MFS general substrate transporter n=1 Tax=Xylona heveae (strain CBS 132557 / TC161) TaxID=1328760 RepID=A0A165H2P2_XYLHT|nr:MFS general substrate transporter [Xylona heveae TC161]KZF22902.1 MFS general substrate transporter [Xylona heveae TC161]